MYFDTHVHLNDPQFDADRGQVLAACQEAGIAGLVEIADAPADWDKAVALSRARPWVRCSLGLHPYYAEQWQPALGEELKRKARLPEVVAAGEIGLDYAKTKVGKAEQLRALDGMLAAAWEARLPVVLHCREAYGDLLPALEAFYGGRPRAGRFHGVLHCFSGTREDALRGREAGFALGADGPVTYPKNQALREALGAAGLDALVLETDSPYLPPQSARGKRNDSRALPEIARALAQALKTTVETVERTTSRNALELFRLEAKEAQ